jgi:hypothetical protein
MSSSVALEAGVRKRLRFPNSQCAKKGMSLWVIWGRSPQTPGIYRFTASMLHAEAASPPRHMPAPRTALRSHPCGAVSSAEVMFSIDRVFADARTLLPDPGPARGKLLLSRHSLWPVLKCPSMAAFQVSPEGSATLNVEPDDSTERSDRRLALLSVAGISVLISITVSSAESSLS